MVSEKVTERIRSTLTLGILKKRYMVLVGLESLSPEARNYMKQVVEEELLKMQDNEENELELETEKPHNKRKREKTSDEESGIEDEDESMAKKSRRQISSSSESEDNEGHKTGSEASAEEEKIKSGSEDAEQEVEKLQQKKSGNRKRRRESEDSPVEDVSESGESDSEGPKHTGIKRENSAKNKRSSSSPGKKTQSGEENETDTGRKSERSDKINESSNDGEKEEKVPVKKETNPDSDSSSLTSLEDDQNPVMKKNQDDKKKKKTVKKDEKTIVQKDDNKQLVRLKRYISLCGVKRNYKKLLDGCRSVRSMVAVLKKELEDLGVEGQPSIKKCKSVKKKREEAQEIAELDVSNIIATQGRPKRRGASVRQEEPDYLSSTYKRTLNSASDSDDENRTHKGQRRATDWANLQGIISDDADSD
ncbi:HIRA-interacting protein 3 isoform X2 [Paralichthys olivaceus]|uniref:HIRA-interacting protein 3 isoform X2 n=1 Tax=Paralichthys olivaceus TaxID=8255 RepID=UPI003753BF3E